MGANLSSLKAVRTSSELKSFLSEDTIEDGFIQNLLQFHIKPPKTIEECKSLVESCTELKNEIPKESSKNLAALVEVTANPDISDTMDEESLKIIHNGLFFIKWFCLTHSDDSDKLLDIKVEIEAIIVPFLIKIITNLAITDKTYHIVLEAADILAILVEISPKIDLFENEKNLIISLLKNFTSQTPAPVFPFGQPSGFGHAIASGMWSVMTVGMGSMNETVDPDYKPLSHSSIALLLKLVDSNTLCNSALCNMADTKETNFSDLHYLLLASDEFTPFLKKMLRANMTYRKFVIMATDLSLIIGPVLKEIYHCGDDDYNKLGDKFELLQILSKDELFNQAIHSCSKSGSNVWYKEKLLKNIKLGGMIVIVLLRSILQNKYDTIFQKTCMNILVQMSVHFSLLDLYPSERLVGCLEFLLKKHSRLVLSSEHLDASNVEDLVKKLLVIINNALVNQTQNNPNLVYSLLYKRELLSSYTNQNDDFIQHFKNVNNLLEHVSNKIDENSDDPNGIMDTSKLLVVIQAAISEYPKERFEVYKNIEEVPETLIEAAKDEINIALSKDIVLDDADVPLSIESTNEELELVKNEALEKSLDENTLEKESNMEISPKSEALSETTIADVVPQQKTTPNSVPVKDEATDELILPTPTEGATIENKICENENIVASDKSVAEVDEENDLTASANEESGTVPVKEDNCHEKSDEIKVDNEETPGTVEAVTDNIVQISHDMIIKDEETNTVETGTIEETTCPEDVSKTKDETEIEEVVKSVEIDTDKTVDMSVKSTEAAIEIEESPIETVKEEPVKGQESIELTEESKTEVTLEPITIEEQKKEGDGNFNLTEEETTSLSDMPKTKLDSEIEETVELVVIDTDKTVEIPAKKDEPEKEIEASPIENVNEETVPGQGTIVMNEEPKTEVTQEPIIIEEQKHEIEDIVTKLTEEETISLEDVSKTKVDSEMEETVESVEIDTDKTVENPANNGEPEQEIKASPTENVEEETVPEQETTVMNEEPKTEVTLEPITIEEQKEESEDNVIKLTEEETKSLEDVSNTKADSEKEEKVESVEIDKDKIIEISANNVKAVDEIGDAQKDNVGEETVLESQTEHSDNALTGEAIVDSQDSEMKNKITQKPIVSDAEKTTDTNKAETVTNEESVEVVKNQESALAGEETENQVEKTELTTNETSQQDSVEEEVVLGGNSETDPIPAESPNIEVAQKESQIKATGEETELTKDENCEDANKDVTIEVKDEIDNTKPCEEEASPAIEPSSYEKPIIMNEVETEGIDSPKEKENDPIEQALTGDQVEVNASVPVEISDHLTNDTVNDEELVSDEKIANTSSEEVAEPLDTKSNSNETKTVEENPQSIEIVSEATTSQTTDESSDGSTLVEFEAFNKETQSPVTFLIDSKMLEKLLIRSESRVIITNFEVLPSAPVRNQSGDSAIFSQDEDSEEKQPTDEPNVYTEFAEQQRKISFAQIHNEKEKTTPKTPPSRNVPVEAMSTNLYLAGSNIKFDLDEKLKICGTPVSPGANIIWKRAAMV